MRFHPLSSTVTSRMQSGANTTEAVVAKERYPLFAEMPFAFLTVSFMLVSRADVESCLSLLTGWYHDQQKIRLRYLKC